MDVLSRAPDEGGRPCPTWCRVRHGEAGRPEDDAHQGGALVVKEVLLRLRATIDHGTGRADAPCILYGAEVLTVHEAEALIGVLTQLVEEAGDVTDRAGGRTHPGGP